MTIENLNDFLKIENIAIIKPGVKEISDQLLQDLETENISHIIFSGYNKKLEYEKILNLNYELIFVSDKNQFESDFPYRITEKNKIIKCSNDLSFKFLYSSKTGKNSILFYFNLHNLFHDSVKLLVSNKEDIFFHTLIKNISDNVDMIVCQNIQES